MDVTAMQLMATDEKVTASLKLYLVLPQH